MSDENMINNENDEAAALFVSTQKKKKAEEEAKRKAAEEQAKREAAEAELRKMEQDVEERKRRAEEEKLALEREAAAAKDAPKEAVKEAPKAKPAAAGAKDKKPLFIGIGAGVAAIVVVAAVLGLRGGKDNTDYTSLQMNGEYTPKSEGYEITMRYPDTLYTEVNEKKADDNLQVTFTPAKKGQVATDVVIKDMNHKSLEKVKKDNIVFFSNKDLTNYLTDYSSKMLENVAPGATISEEKTAEYSADSPGKYTYSYMFSSDDYPSGAGYSWIELNNKDEYKVVCVFSHTSKEDKDSVTAVRDLFFDKNSGDALMMPGANPPTATDADGSLEENTMHMRLRVPKDLFTKWEHTTNYSVWTDTNCARVIVQPVSSEVNLNDPNKSYDYEKLFELMKSDSEKGINNYMDGVSSRTFIEDKRLTDGKFAYQADFRDVIGDVTFWERFYLTYWTDERTEQPYFAAIITLCPESNKDVYQPIFERMLDTLEDL